MLNTIFESFSDVSLIEIFRKIGLVGYTILIILLGFSIVSWAIIFYKYRKLRQIQKESQKFLELYQENNDLAEVYAACVALRICAE
jgi:biopolymer transport protein TolQ